MNNHYVGCAVRTVININSNDGAHGAPYLYFLNPEFKAAALIANM
jgi:hypothetical protein